MLISIYELDTPTLLVDLDRLEANIGDMARAALVGGKVLRPHTKTHKTPEIARMQLAAGAKGITVAKLGEAEVYVEAGFDDIFVANDLVGEAKYARIIALLRRARIVVGMDSLDVARPLAAAIETARERLAVRMEVDTGHGRAGVETTQEACELARFIADAPGLELQGIFTHEGHVYGAADAEDRGKRSRSAAARMREVAEVLRMQGTPVADISMGSTPGAMFLPDEVGITEMRPGVYVFNDRMQVSYGAQPERCALTVLATVVSVRAGGRVVIDAGSKSLASDRPFADGTFGEVMEHPELTFVGASEEHGQLNCAGENCLRVGDKIRIVPNHACTCVNMHDTMTGFRGEHVEAVWSIAARGKVR